MFIKRLFSTVVMWGVVLTTVFVAPPFFSWLLLAVLGSLALLEFYLILEKAGLRVFKCWGTTSGFVLLTVSWFFLKHGMVAPQSHSVESSLLSLTVLVFFFRMLTEKDNPSPIKTVGASLFGVLYVSCLFNFITKIHFIAPGVHIEGQEMLYHGKYAVFYLVLVTKFSDAGAYVTGKLIGRHKLIPRISPGKTWEGTVGGVVVSAVAGLVCFYLFRDSLQYLHMTPFHAILVGAILGAVAVAGDLSESLIKREAGVKDSGHWLPGIGGALDLIDSLLFTAPALYAYLRLILHNG